MNLDSELSRLPLLHNGANFEIQCLRCPHLRRKRKRNRTRRQRRRILRPMKSVPRFHYHQEPRVGHSLPPCPHETDDPATYSHHRGAGKGIGAKTLAVLPNGSSPALTTQETLLLRIERRGTRRSLRLRLWRLGGRSLLMLFGLTASLSPQSSSSSGLKTWGQP